METQWWLLMIASMLANLSIGLAAEHQTRVPSVIHKQFNPNEIVALELAQRFVTLIRLPEPMDEIVLGDPIRFKVENTEKNIYVKPIVSEQAQTNLFVVTKSGQLITIFLRSQSEGSVPYEEEAGRPTVGLVYVLSYASAMRSFLIPVKPIAGQAVPLRTPGGSGAQAGAGSTPGDKAGGRPDKAPRLEALFRQGRSHPPGKWEGEKLQGAILKVVEQDALIYILFRLRNRSHRVMQLLEPQVVLESGARKGTIFRRTVLGSADNLPLQGWLLEQPRMKSGEQVTGVLAVERPVALESNQKIVFTISESLEADKPLRLAVELGHMVLEPTE